MNNLMKQSKAQWRLLRCLLASGLAWSPLVEGAIELGNKGAVAFAVDSEISYDSNVEGNRDEKDDVVAMVRPELLYRFDAGTLNIDAFVGYEVTEYDQESQYDSTDLKSGLTLLYPVGQESRFDLRFDAGFNEVTGTDANLLRVVEREVTTASLRGRYDFTEDYFVRGEFRFSDESYQTDGFDDVQEITVPLDFFYRYSENLAFGLGYRYRDTRVSEDGPEEEDNSDHAVYLALEGRVAPSTEGEVRVGLQRREFETSDVDDDDSFFAEVSLAWEAADPTLVELSAGQEFETSGVGETVERIYAELSVRHRFNDKLSARLAGGYEERDFSDTERTDEEFYLRLNGDYVLIENRLELRGSIFHSTQDSDFDDAEFDRTLASLGLRAIF